MSVYKILRSSTTNTDCMKCNYREAIDRPTVLYILYSTMSAQHMNLLPENTYYNDSILPKSLYHIYRTTLQCLSCHVCTITVILIIFLSFKVII